MVDHFTSTANLSFHNKVLGLLSFNLICMQEMGKCNIDIDI